eukprot:TRINITY_DN10265_c0_g1_i1.p1 TRINITY_DN10265_c0_g1~~TRINITY_DN10265_c0_g1_i1.p1  ORF type:complete len:309 (+),score=51.45 TRINITY_DN10265_c0_g1_i1:85-1011(+)
MMTVILSRSLRRQYHAKWLSAAGALQIVFLLLVLIIPFLIAYRCGGFWLRQSSYREQPRISFNHQLIIELEDAQGQTYGYSTFANLNTMYGSKLMPGVIKSRNHDDNEDSIVDSSELIVSIPKSLDQRFVHVRLLALYTYQLEEFGRIALQAPVFVEIPKPSGLSHADITGHLGFYQHRLLPQSGSLTTFNRSLIKVDSLLPSDYSIAQVMKKASAFDYGVTLSNAYTVTSQAANQRQVEVVVHLRCPETEYLYRPDVWHELKQSWVQYLAVLVPFYCLCASIRNFIVDQQLVTTVRHDDISGKLKAS